MASKATEWHKKRRTRILKKGRLKINPTRKFLTELSLVGVPLFHFLLCYLASLMNIWQLTLLAYFVGSVVFMYIFSNAHEIFHGALGSKLKHPGFKNGFLRFATLTDISTGLYLYYKYGHGPHHSIQGEHSVQEVQDEFLNQSMDIDPITNLKYLYKLKFSPGEKPRYLIPAMETNRLVRFCVLFFMPLGYTLYELMVEPFKFLAWFKVKGSPRARRVVEDAFIQMLIIVSVMTVMGLAFGNWNHLLYIFLCRVFFLGFLHPYAILWATIHTTTDDGESFQPATSIRGSFATFLCAGINLHLDHHDMPWVSRAQLSEVKDAYPEFYQDQMEFAGLSGAAEFLFQPRLNNLYAQGEAS